MAYWIQKVSDSGINNSGYKEFRCDFRSDIEYLPTQSKSGINGETCSYGSECLCLEDSSVWTLGKGYDKWIEFGVDTLINNEKVFGFEEDMDELDPYKRIHYIGANKNYTPMTVDIHGNHTANYGSWGNFKSIVENKPYMVKSTGEADYQLDENDYTKKLNGEPSDASNAQYDGGAFSKFVKVYVKREIIGNHRYVYFTFDKDLVAKDNKFIACGFIDEDGSEMDYVWLPMFYSGIVDGKMKSIADLDTKINQTIDENYNSIIAFSDRGAFLGGAIIETIRDMIYMFFKTTNTQEACGYGNCSSEIIDGKFTYYQYNHIVGGGQFYGTSDYFSLNKMFHSIVLGSYQQLLIDPYYIYIDDQFKVSTNYMYDLTGENYLNTGIKIKENYIVSSFPYKCEVVDGFGSILTPEYKGDDRPDLECGSYGYCSIMRLRDDNNNKVIGRFGFTIEQRYSDLSYMNFVDMSIKLKSGNRSTALLLRPRK